MSDIGSSLPVPINQTRETKEMKLKWLQAAKQEKISKIVHLNQAIEDLVKGKIPAIQREVLYAQQELSNLEIAEKQVMNSIEAEITKES